MNNKFIKILRSPISGKALDYKQGSDNNFEFFLATPDNAECFPIIDNIPRFVDESNYADNFGMQWNLFSKTQLDSYSGHPISKKRFWDSTGWLSDELKDKWILDVGCGSGRFAEVALSSGANVVAIDYSSAVDACYSNLSNHSNFFVIQANIYSLPFADETFDYVYSLGVLQHTPNVKESFKALIPLIKPGGKICVDYYEKSIKSLLHPKYILRPITKKIDKKLLFKLICLLVPSLLFLSNFFKKIPFIGNLVSRFIPVANYKNIFPLSYSQLREWAVLDTFDWLSPTYDNPQSFKSARNLMEEADLKDIEIFKGDHLVARGSKKKS